MAKSNKSKSKSETLGHTLVETSHSVFSEKFRNFQANSHEATSENLLEVSKKKRQLHAIDAEDDTNDDFEKSPEIDLIKGLPNSQPENEDALHINPHKSPESSSSPKSQATECFYINKLKQRPKSVVEFQLKPQADAVSLRSENEAVASDEENTSQTGYEEAVELKNYVELLNQLRDLPSCHELELQEGVDQEKAVSIPGSIRGRSAANSTGMADTDTDQESVSEAQPSPLGLSAHSLAEVSSSEIEQSDSFADDAELSVKFTEDEPAPLKQADFVFDSDEVQIIEDEIVPLELNPTICNFLDEIIDKVVAKAEKPERLLNQTLDKAKLMDALLAEADGYRFEHFTNQYLSNRITDILVRRGKYSLVTPSKNAEMNKNNQSRCRFALNELDYWLKREQLSVQVARDEVQRLVSEEDNRRTQDDNLWQRLESLINDTLLVCPNFSDNLKILAANTTRRLSKMRDELSETRLNLILKQHTYSHIKMKIHKMDTISEHLTMHKYLSVEADVENLDRTLESRNLSILKASNLINSKIHSVSHLRCRRKTLSRKLTAAQCILESLKNQFKALRVKAYRCNKTHNKLLSDLGNVRHKGGIVLYPLLIADYDQTVEAVGTKRSEMEALRAQHDSLLERLAAIEETRRMSLTKHRQSRNQLRTSTLVERMERRGNFF
ncbi:uncharacterized protein LOC117584111 [Drosophila guanche]|uniref:Blast:Glycine-rich protein A3 n=1 Tax=Drosophila guanche TaxID=7266 RepID=A0A3B0JMW6_DROGU|nr:uncharacterized protein LOC117584111 [Drosophila guanche]SPP82213.1 blast:Glycine-rich protein A3 [Drosophila guanche]